MFFVFFSSQIVNDVKFTVSQTVEPIMEKGLTRFNEKLTMFSENITKKTKDDSCITSTSPTKRVIRGIDDPLLNESFSDSAITRGKGHHRRSSCTSVESVGETSNHAHDGGYEIRGKRWATKDC